MENENDISAYIEGSDDLILKRIFEVIKERKLSKTEVAKVINMSPQQFALIENKKNRLTLTNAIALLKFLDIDNLFQNKNTSPTIDFLKQLEQSKDSLFELREVLIENLKAVNAFIQAPKDKNPNNRETQINLKATEEEKKMIVEYAKQKGLSLIDSLIEAVGDKQKKENE